MESGYFSKKIGFNLAHSPTWMLAIGYVVFWGEMTWRQHNYGQTTPLAWVLAGLVVLMGVVRGRLSIASGIRNYRTWFGTLPKLEQWIFGIGLFLSLVILGISFLASAYPPHLSQEYDALNYHLTIPRQLLIRNSFAHIPWATADLMPLPIDFALAPFWFATALPNKMIHFVFLLGLLGITLSLATRLGIRSFAAKTLLIFVLLGTHGLGIQFGVAMLDIMMCYLFLAALDSWLNGCWALALLEMCFYFWSKSFTPFQVLFLLGGLFVLSRIFQRFGFSLKAGFEEGAAILSQIPHPKAGRLLFLFLVFSGLIAGPFLVKSLAIAQTPLFPFSPGIMAWGSQHPALIDKFKEAAPGYVGFKDVYGHGRSVVAFVKHLWLLAVPEQGVNNAYDYPLGLTYLIFVIPFFYFLARNIRERQFPLLPVCVLLYWLGWWFGSQQARFFYIPLVLIFITVSQQLKFDSKILYSVILVALLLNVVSLGRAHRHLLGKTAWEVLRAEDKISVAMSRQYIQEKRSDVVDVQNKDVPFARFPVDVVKEELPFVIHWQN